MEFALDTSVVIGFLKGNRPDVEITVSSLHSRMAALTSVTVFELKVGIPPESKRDLRLDKLFRYLPVLPLDLPAALAAAQVENQLRADGAVIGAPDTLIAGICLSRNLTLVTNNIRHFERVEGLKVISPAG